MTEMNAETARESNGMKREKMDKRIKTLLNDERTRTLLEIKSICETFETAWKKQGGDELAEGASRIRQWIEIALQDKP